MRTGFSQRALLITASRARWKICVFSSLGTQIILGPRSRPERRSRVLLNDRLLINQHDYMISQQGKGPFDVSFLFNSLTLNPGDIITLKIPTITAEPAIQRAELLQVVFAPGHAVRDFFAR